MPVWATGLAAKLIGIGIACLIAAAGGFWLADTIDQNTIKDMKLANAQAITDAWKLAWLERGAQDAATLKANNANSADQSHINNNTGEVIRAVPIYITAKDDAACKLPAGFSRLLDAALLGVAPDSLPADAGEPVGTAATATLSRAVPVLSQTLGDYAAIRARLLNARQDWQDQIDAKAHVETKTPPQPSWWQRNIGGVSATP